MDNKKYVMIAGGAITLLIGLMIVQAYLFISYKREATDLASSTAQQVQKHEAVLGEIVNFLNQQIAKAQQDSQPAPAATETTPPAKK